MQRLHWRLLGSIRYRGLASQYEVDFGLEVAGPKGELSEEGRQPNLPTGEAYALLFKICFTRYKSLLADGQLDLHNGWTRV